MTVTEAGTARGPRRRWSDALTVGGFRTGVAIAKYLPSVVAHGLTTPIAFGASFADAERRAMVERHMRRVNPTWPDARIRRAVRQAFDSYTRYWVESLRLPSLPPRVVEEGLRITGFGHVPEALEQGRGAILAMPHLGGWEWAGRWMADRGYKLTVVVERIEPPALFDWFVKWRSDLGLTVVPLGPDAAGAVMGALRENHIVCLLCDRDIQGGGVDVEFFGERTTLPPGPATLALRTGAPLLPVAVYFTDAVNGHHAIVHPPVQVAREGSLRADVSRVTQMVAGELEDLIRRAPEQWHLFQPNWPSDPGYPH